MYVVDKHLRPVPVGVTGELCIAGMNVGQGYLNRPDLTAEKFVDNPFGEGKMYRTGDNAYWREDGNIVFCGRKDSQIKLNGQRIEIGEIEAVISALTEVESSAVLVRKINQRDVLVLFYSGKKNSDVKIKDICRERLPKYMVPSFIIHLDEMPLNQNGKLDRNVLANKEISVYNTDSEKPVNDTEIYICEVFEDILGEKNISRNDDFFEIGGTSYSMISLLSEQGFENITAAEFMRNPTPALLASLLQKKTIEKAEYLEALYIPENPKQTLILLPFAGGGAEAYSNFVLSLKKANNNIAVYFIRYLHSKQECKNAANEIADFFKNTEILFYSHCVGSAVALNIISYLEEANIPIKHYFAAASIPPAKKVNKNTWNYIPDSILKRTLLNAGAKFDKLSNKDISLRLKQFREDTDFAVNAFSEFGIKITVPVSVIISKKDPFTKNYDIAESIWKRYTDNVIGIRYIDSNSHYFQSDNSNELIEIILHDT
jgi:surfactin synthase thioesterase subunit